MEFIKKEFLKERGATDVLGGPTWHFSCPEELRNGREIIRIIFMEGAFMMKDEIMKCETESELNDAFCKWGKITLREWIETL